MKMHKRCFLGLLALAVAAIVVSVALTVIPGTPTAAAGTEVEQVLLPTILASADFAVSYSNVGQLTKAAAAVVRGEVTGVSYVDFNSTAYTRVTFKVTACLKGGIAVGEEITVAEVGGVTTLATVNGDKFGAPTAKDAETKVRVLLEGAPLSEVGDQCLYFLGTGSIGVVPGTYYVPLGAFQGRFAIKGQVAERFVPEGWGGAYTSLPMAENEINQAVLRATTDK